MGGPGWGRVGGGGGQDGCELKIEVFVKLIEVFVKLQKKNWGGGGGGVGGGGGRVGGQGGCERRIKVFVKIQKKKYFFFFWGGGPGGECRVEGVSVDVKEELKFL